jgi:hypothetical protein
MAIARPVGLALSITLALAAAGCSPSEAGRSVGPEASQGASAAASSTPTALQAARAELDHALARLEVTHPEPFHAVERQAFVAELEGLKQRLPDLTPDQAAVELMRVWAMLSAQRDGHQFALPLDFDLEPILPIKVYEFAEGVFITGAMAPHGDLVGARLVAVGETPTENVLDLLEPLVPRDGPATVPSFRPMYLLRATVLRGLGIVGDGAVPLTVSLDGEERRVELEPVPSSEHQAWAGWLALHGLAPRDGLRHSQQDDAHFEVEPMEDGRVLYVRYAQVQPVMPGAVDELRRMAADPSLERVIVDLRQNTGGDNTTYGSLLSALTQVATDRPGTLVVLIDRVTFSAAANFATRLEQQTDASFAGEPMGGGLNFWNDVDWIELPEFVMPMRVAVSTRYWEMAEPADQRLTIEPDLAMPLRAADYFDGRDALFDAVLAGEPG